MLRRNFLLTAAAVRPLLRGAAALSRKERVDRALAGKDVDRPPFSLWHHFGLKTAQEHAARTLEFHRAYRTDFVKVMSDFDYPKPAGKWYELKVNPNPFPDQIRSLELIRDGLNGDGYMLETVFNPFNVAQKLSSKDEVLRLMKEKPQALLDALDVITQSEILHAKRALSTGAAGILFSVANANQKELSPAEYEKFSRPFDKRFMEAVADARLNFLHLHVEPAYLPHVRDFKGPVVNYSMHVSGIPIGDMRREYPSMTIAGGVDEVNYRKLAPEEMKRQWQAAARAAGSRYILTPGCSVPNDSAPEELTRLAKAVGA